MKLRSELMPPKLDESLVSRLTSLSEKIDCGDPGKVQDLVIAFNRDAGTNFGFSDFQGIYGGQDHNTWVRKVLASPYLKCVDGITRSELAEMARRVMENDGPELAVDFWLSMLEVNIPDDRISDLIFWPNEYFGDPNYAEDLSPEQVIETALENKV
ncbi:hypothetical protein NNO07_27370 [Pseudomonas resinovorans]|uniref:DUF4375 domain-containing protein n=1 Tax=Metapseudomonas resinovorans TaxID=53412 RepID=A0ABT4YD23_METRE|nr:hypothetical protein [Pseudomonas resinovorans]MDA8486796.1 hypothetical protein [Pseudomonas resinovorans]